jgi:lysophospholipase L1-like esterase
MYSTAEDILQAIINGDTLPDNLKFSSTTEDLLYALCLSQNKYAIIKEIQKDVYNWGIDHGTDDAFHVTLNPLPNAIYDGMNIRVRSMNDNYITSPTLTINSFTPIVITKYGGRELAVGDITKTMECHFKVNLLSNRCELLNPCTANSAVSFSFADNVDGNNKRLMNIASNSSTETDAVNVALLKGLTVNWPLEVSTVPTQAALFEQMRGFLVDMYLEGTPNPALTYSFEIVRRNNSGAWVLYLYSHGSTHAEVAEYRVTATPENGSKVTVHTLTAIGGSGITGRVAVRWDKFTSVGGYADGMTTANGFKLDDRVWDKNNAVFLRAYEANEYNSTHPAASVGLAGTIRGGYIPVDQYKHSRGDAEYLGNNNYQYAGVGAYSIVTEKSTFNRIKYNVWGGANTVCEIRFYTSIAQQTNVANMTLIQAFTYTAGQLNQIGTTLSEFVLPAPYTVEAGAYVYCLVSTTSGTNCKIGRWSVLFGSPPERYGFYTIASNPWGGTWSQGSLSPAYCGTPLWLLLYGANELQIATNTAAITALQAQTPVLSLNIPSNIYAVVGQEFCLWYDGLILSEDMGLSSPLNYIVEVYCTKGISYERAYRFTPVVGDIGTYSMVISVFNAFKVLIESKTITLNVTAAEAPTGVKNILMVGDSITAANTITTTIQGLFNALGSNIPLFWGTQGTNPSKHEGHPGWAYVNFATNTGTNPFWSSGMNIANYRSVVGLSGYFDVVTIQLGGNDCFGTEMTQAAIDTIVNYAKTIATAFWADCATTKILIMLPTTCGNTKGGWGANYNALYYKEYYMKNIFLLRKSLIAAFDAGVYNSNAKVGIAGLAIDRYYGYPLASQAISARVATTETVHSNALHPAASGYQQMGDCIYAQIQNEI